MNRTVISSQESKLIPLQVVFICILFLSSIFFPFVLVYPLQEWIMSNDTYWFFQPRMYSSIVFIGSICALCVIWGGLLIYVTKVTHRSRLIMGSGIISCFLALLIAISACFYYEHMSNEGICINPLTSFDERCYLWDEVTDAKSILNPSDQETKEIALVFSFKDGTEWEFPLNHELMGSKSRITTMLKEQNIEVKRVK
ncbi:hypothetical protein [Metabacillus iocasae]|uniref:Uncharacterized protein n=1 Tax=Priestia iocasae TaxID=2291674 RepID=A0ABS2QW88_9BACI|nr:hypothetical protein [Metabacillus iocasae]MBM7703252.1 hypothetical protein [Metabacillus iocasae]